MRHPIEIIAFVILLIPVLIGVRAVSVFIVHNGGIIAGLIAIIGVLTIGWLLAPYLDE